MGKRNVLYRFFDQNDALLYIGISMTPWERFRQHRAQKPWWDDIRKTTMQPYPSRAEVLRAEREAIVTERPRYNVVHNKGLHLVANQQEPDGFAGWCIDRSGNVRRGSFQLVYEVNCDPISDHWTPKEISARELLRLWVETYYQEKDVAPISWYVDGPGIFESASCSNYWWFEDRCEWFGDFYTPIMDAATDKPVAISDLPVQRKRWNKWGADKGGFITEATGWTPKPLARQVRVGLLERMGRIQGSA